MVTRDELISVGEAADDALLNDEEAAIELPAALVSELVTYVVELEEDLMALRHDLAEFIDEDEELDPGTPPDYDQS